MGVSSQESMSQLPYKDIRKDFPILQTKMNAKSLVFLDSAASSQKPQRVIDAFNDYYRYRHANIHRGAYRLSYEATDLYEKTRQCLARFLNAPEVESCIFTRNASESLNLIAYTWGEKYLEAGDEILVSELEHHSNLVPWMQLAKRKQARLAHIPLTEDGHYDYSHIQEVVHARTRIIAVQHMSNALGSIHRLDNLAKLARSVGALFVVDGAQGAAHLQVDVQAIDCDFYACSAHKMLGPTGVGVLYGKKEILEKMPPFLGGGDMILSVDKDHFTEAPLPRKFEAGTPDIAGVVAFALALDYLGKIGLEHIHAHELELTAYALAEMQKLEGIEIYGGQDMNKDRGGIISFNLAGAHPHDVATVLDEEGIAVRAGHHCCEPWMKSRGLSGTVRVSFYLYNGPEDIDRLLCALRKVRSIFKLPARLV